jgi:Cu+-exporting ATPase
LSSGTDIAAKSADIVIMGGDIEKLMDCIRISKATMHIIKQNLWWAVRNPDKSKILIVI